MTKYRWSVGHNLPGYTPDSEASHFTNWKEARDAFILNVRDAIENQDKPSRYKVELANCEYISKQRRAFEHLTKIGEFWFWLVKI